MYKHNTDYTKAQHIQTAGKQRLKNLEWSQKQEILIHTPTWTNLKNVVKIERQKTTL